MDYDDDKMEERNVCSGTIESEDKHLLVVKLEDLNARFDSLDSPQNCLGC